MNQIIPKKIFESINATGRKLSEFDYLRNNLFLRARQLDKPESKSISDSLYQDHWKDFENDDSYWNVNKLDSFLITFLITKLGPKCFEGDETNKYDNKKAFEVYQKSYYKKLPNNLSQKEKVTHEFSELQRHANAYREADFGDLDFVNKSDKIRFHMKFYNDLNITSLLPFILYLKCEANQNNDQLHIAFRVIESYLIRRMVHYGCGRNDIDETAYEQIYKYFSNLIDESQNKTFNIEEFVQSLENWPDDTQLAKDLQRTANDTREENSSISREQARFLLSYIFYRIERHTNEKNELSFNDFFLEYKPTRIVSWSELRSDFSDQKHLSDDDWKNLQSDWISIGNLTFSTIDAESYSFQDSSKSLSSSS